MLLANILAKIDFRPLKSSPPASLQVATPTSSSFGSDVEFGVLRVGIKEESQEGREEDEGGGQIKDTITLRNDTHTHIDDNKDQEELYQQQNLLKVDR